MRNKQIKGTILAGAVMMAAMSMTANVMAADSAPAVQSEAQPTVTPAAETSTEPSTEAPTPTQTETVQPETPAETISAETEPPQTDQVQPDTPAEEDQVQPEVSAETEPSQSETPAPETTAPTPTPVSDSSSEAETSVKPSKTPQSQKGAANTRKKGTGKNNTTKELEKYVTENATNSNVKISGFTIDPSKYPPVDVNENTRIIYQYLIKEMDLNHAAACGVLANIQPESNFNTFAVGDGGTSYRICQWHNGRFSALMAHCGAKGLDYNTLEGQLSYLKQELSTGYLSVLNVLRNVSDTEQGAYDAAYAWCMHFEIPADTVNRSIQRGNLAREYFHKEFSFIENETERIGRLLEFVS